MAMKKIYSDDESHMRRRLGAKRGETTRDAVDRQMDRTRYLSRCLSRRDRKAKKATERWHGYVTVPLVASKAGVCAGTVRRDVRRGLVTPYGTKVIDGATCFVFTNAETARYVAFRDTRRYHNPRYGNSRAHSIKVIRHYGPDRKWGAVATLGIKYATVMKIIRREKLKGRDIYA